MVNLVIAKGHCSCSRALGTAAGGVAAWAAVSRAAVGSGVSEAVKCMGVAVFSAIRTAV